MLLPPLLRVACRRAGLTRDSLQADFQAEGLPNASTGAISNMLTSGRGLTVEHVERMLAHMDGDHLHVLAEACAQLSGGTYSRPAEVGDLGVEAAEAIAAQGRTVAALAKHLDPSAKRDPATRDQLVAMVDESLAELRDVRAVLLAGGDHASGR